MKHIWIFSIISIFSSVMLYSKDNQELDANFVALRAVEKQSLLYKKVQKSEYSQPQIMKQKNPSTLSMASLLSAKSLMKSFLLTSDEFPKERTKLLHTYGSVAKISFEPTRNPNEYTGLFASGAHGIIRLSLASLSDNYTPGIAIKFLIDNNISQHAFAMDSLDGQGDDFNFFSHSFKTKIKDPKSRLLRTLSKVFKKALILLHSEVPDPTFQSVKDLAKLNRFGDQVKKSKAPFALTFQPSKKMDNFEGRGNNLRVTLKSSKLLKKGFILYKVYAQKSKKSKRELIGRIKLESKLIPSRYGDRKLFFRHNID